MQLTINGEKADISPMTVQTLIESRGLNPAVVVVEYNGTILKRDLWNQTELREMDILEIVSFVGGG